MRTSRRSRGPAERRAFVLEHTRLTEVPLVPEIRVYTARGANAVWFETARWLEDDDVDMPFWCVPWAGGQALARYVLDHPEMVRGARVLDFACGGGLVGIAAALAGGRVSAVDIDPLARAATELAAEANAVAIEVATRDLVGDVPDVDVVLAGDIWYERAPAARFRRWLDRLARRGLVVLTSDAGRLYAPRRGRELARYEVPTPFDLEAVATRMTRVLAIEAIASASANDRR